MSLFGLIPSAVAQTTNAAAGGGSPMDMLQQFAPFIIVIGIFYFLLIRPQQQKAKQLKAQLSELRRGDNIITAGGIIGTVARVTNDDELSVEIAEGVRVRVLRSTVTGITAKGEPRTDAKAASDETEDKPKAASTSKYVRRGKTAPANESKPQA
jgi:preprotein translocase subunit YajC